MSSYLVASVGSWNRELYEKYSSNIDGNWRFVDTPDKLVTELKDFSPKFIFFPHWRWIVPEDIINNYECVCFHMTDVPYGRGGSPLQNLILAGNQNTVLTALRMEKGLDSGPVYLKLPLNLDGSARQIYLRASELSWEIIKKLVTESHQPFPQKGEPTFFKRRKPEESELPSDLDIGRLYNFIRMLDADDYPYAFINYGNYKLCFNEADFSNGKLTAKVEFVLKGSNDK
ncbi:methionyl-tRNA formyltransferase [Leptospira sp. 85282-16]|uniref:Methionyl-tRNA formyltransferase n=1 Tax=Leptospira montravelensis TaxID=2484961 RepID=A0ABY2LW88_9LEPT|nr:MULTISPECIES: methionyl-tRNA formyltransferase [Leptospira]MCT8332168.1 methionyl-tRNA formyltransferase [Leptospira sp. 85282-16]TGK83403.1 methionyl-tRNA formyltransferase [Leptospira montravelensis]TGL05405.1 methionyl-tRNA formyltransferase [Leptospira montravelensis]